MNLKEEIEQIWTSNTSTSLGRTLPSVLDLLLQARRTKEIIPIELELDIVMTANYAMDYGSTTESLNHISLLWKDGYNHLLNHVSSISNDLARKINRLNSIFANAMLGSIIYDLQNKSVVTSEANNILTDMFQIIGPSEDYVLQSLEYLAQSQLEFLMITKMNSWFYENVSDAITILSLIKDRNGQIEKFKEPLRKVAEKIKNLGSKFRFEEWENTFSNQTERYRFISILMNNANPSDSTWKEIAQSLKD
ncbi:MAG: hypothetical protein D6732_07325 [Methanobacteriota archaeon]|nr:MAG: hypothetical protein D6732_07325 [Euryarchaeota archaeon]